MADYTPHRNPNYPIAEVEAQLLAHRSAIPPAPAVSLLPGDLKEAIHAFTDAVFPGYFSPLSAGENLHRLARALGRLALAALQGENAEPDAAEKIVTGFLLEVPRLRDLLETDVHAMFDMDPAARTEGEIVLCYPGIKALTHFRMAHTLHAMGLPVVPRMITERAHSQTGIDIHPGAQIGPFFAIDHGTGVVIGETCVIGRHVRLYQGVTLGARSIPSGEKGRAQLLMRHPILEDGVVVYSNSTILGRITIGRNAIIGGNRWVTESVAAGEKIL